MLNYSLGDALICLEWKITSWTVGLLLQNISHFDVAVVVWIHSFLVQGWIVTDILGVYFQFYLQKNWSREFDGSVDSFIPCLMVGLLIFLSRWTLL